MEEAEHYSSTRMDPEPLGESVSALGWLAIVVFVATGLYSIVGNMVLGIHLSTSGVKLPFFWKGIAVFVWRQYRPQSDAFLDRYAASVAIAALLTVAVGCFAVPLLPF